MDKLHIGVSTVQLLFFLLLFSFAFLIRLSIARDVFLLLAHFFNCLFFLFFMGYKFLRFLFSFSFFRRLRAFVTGCSFSFYAWKFSFFDRSFSSSQEKFLVYLCQHLSVSGYGRKYSVLADGTDFFSLPILTGTAYEKEVSDYLRESDPLWLWSAPIRYFSVSSGTDRKKYIPLPDDVLWKLNRDGGSMMMGLLHQRYGFSLWYGDFLPFIGSLKEISDDYIAGDVSAILSSLRNPFILSYYPFSLPVLLDSYASAHEVMVHDLPAHQHTSILTGVTTWLVDHIRALKRLHADKRGGEFEIKDVLPSFTCLLWGGVVLSSYEKELESWGVDIRQDCVGVYNASEGMFGVQAIGDENGGWTEDGDPIYRFLPTAFYECAPLSSFDDYGNFLDGSSIVACKDLTQEYVDECDGYFALIISTPGLYRVIMDKIRIVSLNPLRYTIVGRMQDSLNISGEELERKTVDDVFLSFREEIDVLHYTASVGIHGEGESFNRHEWILEVHDDHYDLVLSDLVSFRDRFDALLQERNPDYKVKRSTYNETLGRYWLEEPVVRVVKVGTFLAFTKYRKGGGGGQSKIARMHQDPEKYLHSFYRFLDNSGFSG